MPVTADRVQKIAILGAGPSGLFAYKQLVAAGAKTEVVIFEKTDRLGAGMPYSPDGANTEHITNVSDNELPDIVIPVTEWIKTVPEQTLWNFRIDRDQFHEYKVIPRLLFGMYLSDQFEALRHKANTLGIKTRVHFKADVTDIIDYTEEKTVVIEMGDGTQERFDAVIICTGHTWPAPHEGRVKGYFDSPYPPSKLRLHVNHPVAVTGASLTAIDAIRTLARENGNFVQEPDGGLRFTAHPDSPRFKIVMHSRNGLLPAIRFHLDEPQLTGDALLTDEQVERNKQENGGFLSLDYIFDENFKKGFQEKDPKFYQRIKNMKLEEFVDTVMDMREGKEPFQLFIEEYQEAQKSIKDRKSIYWKEMLAELSFTLNYPAKYMSAEDMMRLKKVLMPLISMVIAFVPQSSCDELLALYHAGRLELVSVGPDSYVEAHPEEGIMYHYSDEQGKKHKKRFKTYVNCIGQQHVPFEKFPYKSLLSRGSVSQAMIQFRSAEAGASERDHGNEAVICNTGGDYFLKVPGITINDCFQIVNAYGTPNPRIYIMAVPYIAGYNPDYSGLDFCDQASRSIVQALIPNLVAENGVSG